MKPQLTSAHNPNLIDITGATRVRFGPFLAMTSSAVLEETETRAVWKVWCDEDEKNPGKIMTDLTRAQAVALAQMCAQEWRRIGKPKIREVGVVADGPRGPFHIVINKQHRATLRGIFTP